MIALTIKASLAIVAALLAVLAARRARASLRHLTLASLFVFLLLLPVVQFAAPSIDIPVKSASRIAGNEFSGTRMVIAAAAKPLSSTLPRGAAGIDWRTTLSAIYGGIAALLLVRLAMGVVRLRRLERGGDVWLEGTARMNEIASEANIRRTALVVLSEEATVPLTFGFRRSTIVLPSTARVWSDEELARALRHELEHVEREDWVMQLLARAACAVYWPHPLVWVAWRRFCLEAERACDDAVIGSAEPDAYAGQLVTLARDVRRLRVPALAMASPSRLRVRIEAILDRSQPRGPHGRSAALAAGVVLLALLVSIAPARLIDAATKATGHPGIVLENSPLGEAFVKAGEAGDVKTMQVLMEAGIDVNSVVPGDGTALIGAARGGQQEAIEFLLQHGADPNVAASGDGNPLIAAAGEGHSGIVMLLLDRGARIDDIVPGDENALMQAARNGHEEVVRLLVQRGADVNARAWEQGELRTALRMARRGRHLAIENLLLSAGARD